LTFAQNKKLLVSQSN